MDKCCMSSAAKRDEPSITYIKIQEKYTLFFDKTAGLVRPEFGVQPLGFEQLLMRAIFYDSALVEHDNSIQTLDGTQSVGDDDSGATLHEIPEGGLDKHLAFAVQGTGGLIED